MKNTLSDLNNHLFEALERLNDDDLDDEGLEKELKKADGIVNIANTIIHNGELAFKTMQHFAEYGIKQEEAEVAPMLLVKKNDH